MKISKDKATSIQYKLTNTGGDVLDQSADGSPLTYLHGHKNIIAGLESALEGKEKGDQVQVTVQPADGYGERNDELVQKVPRTLFDAGVDLQPGMRFEAKADQGTQIIKVVSIEEEEVTVDANHPLAGEVLSFDVTVADVREATQEEIDHGHVHGPGGHHHG